MKHLKEKTLNNIVTRDLINKNIIFEDCSDLSKSKRHTYDDLSSKIDAIKNLFEEHGSSPGDAVLIGMVPSLDQIAVIFAAIELGLVITIVDYNRPDEFKQYDYVDPKTEILLPIKFFILKDGENSQKHQYFTSICEDTIVLSDKELNYSKNTKIHASENQPLMKCTSSGTTGTPKHVIHNHEFCYRLMKRNTKYFYGSVAITSNLNHGSSFLTYFMPAIITQNVSKIVNTKTLRMSNLTEFNNTNFDHLLVPYSGVLEKIAELENYNTTYYTLSRITDKTKRCHARRNFKEAISFFGSNETSGPVLENRASNDNFDGSHYKKIDNFYDINLNNNVLTVGMPYYETEICTNDKFKKDDDYYVFYGREDLIRINGKHVNINKYHELANNLVLADLVYDTLHQKIYLAFWKKLQPDDLRFFASRIDKALKESSEGDHYISKFKSLDKSEFMSGVKLDQELLRNYFRNYVE